MDEEWSHFIGGVWDNWVGPQYYCTDEGPIWETENGGEEKSPDGVSERHPQVHKDEKVGEITEIKKEVVPAKLLVGVPAVGEKDDGFL